MDRKPVPRFEDNYTEEAAQARRDFLTQQTGGELTHTGHYSIDPASVRNNTENFIGVLQMPVGVAGPVLINGEEAQGWFYVPMATTEGTLVASYSRGMRMLSESGGVKVTVIEEFMQRAPLFEFEDARAGKRFVQWLRNQEADIRTQAQATTGFGNLQISDFHLNGRKSKI